MIAGVYVITNEKTGEQYVGSSSDIEERLRHHGSALRGRRHESQAMQAAWNRDGAQVFTFRVLEQLISSSTYSAREEREEREAYWIHELRPVYNSARKRWYGTEEALRSGEPLRGDEW